MPLLTLEMDIAACEPEPINGYNVRYREKASGNPLIDAGNFAAGHVVINLPDEWPDDTLFDGIVMADCGDDGFGPTVGWSMEGEPGEDFFNFIGSGRGNSSSEACADAVAFNRGFWSECPSLAPGCHIYLGHNGFPALTGYSKIYSDGQNWDVNISGVITGSSLIQC